jgi:acetyl-CoA C-acetyltransferase
VEDLAKAVVTEVVTRSGVDPERIDDVVMAQSYANSETPCVGRWVALHAGLPLGVAGMQVDRRCGGGLQALVTAAMQVQTGVADIVIAGGVESMSNIELYSTQLRWGARAGGIQLHDRLDRGRERAQPQWRHGPIGGMVETAENIARQYSISREEADEYAVTSHQRASAAWESGKFEDEVVSVPALRGRNGDSAVVDRDEGVRPEASVESLGRLRTIFPQGVVTAGNACQQNDAAAACLVVADDVAGRLGLTPVARLVDWTAVGCDPAVMGLGPVPAVAKLFARTGLGFSDLALVELNEAFAVQVLGVMKAWGFHDPGVVNVNGGGISLGHPIAATGVRLMVSMLHELHRRGGGYGLETMCIGGGQGMAALLATI